MICKTSKPEDEVQEILPNLELVLAAHATDAVPQGGGNAASASGKHDLVSKSFPASSLVDVVALEDKTYVIWKLILHLARPRARLQRPAIYFTVNLGLGSSILKGHIRGHGEYLESYKPLPANVLEPLEFDPALRGFNVYLPESRITKVAPRPPSLQDATKPIRGASKRAFPAVPAVFSRIRYTALSGVVIASLHLETSHVIAGSVTINDVKLAVSNAQVEHLTNVALPLETRAGDETITLYRLTPLQGRQNVAPGRPSPVSVSIFADALLDQGSHIKLNSTWQTQVDLSQSSSRPTYKWSSRPLSSSSGHRRGQSAQSSHGVVSFEEPNRHVEGESGITFCFKGPATTQKGSDVQLDVQCNNRSGRPRRFALIPILPKGHKATRSTLSATVNTDLVANIFHAPPLERKKPADVLDLNADVRIGPLPSGACFQTHLRFRVMSSGVLNLGAVRVLDLDSRQTVDLRELPDIVATDATD